MAAVTLDSLSKTFGDVTAVRSLGLDIEDGEFVTFVGPSGCGKTTSLRMLAGFETPSTGRIRIDGDDVTATRPHNRDVGMVFQSFALFPHLTVGENIAYGLHESTDLSRGEIDARVEDLLETIRLPGFADRQPSELSGGQKQRVALARALAIEPEVLLLDEPLASLDKKLREQMQVELRRIHDDLGITTVFVTHNQREAMSMSDRIVVMRDGEVVQTGTPEDVYRNPTSPFVADFIGTSNVFDGVTSTGTQSVSVLDAELTVSQPLSSSGTDVTVTFRPGSLDIEAGTSSPAGGNVFTGTVGVKRYLGEYVEYHVDVGDDTVVVHSSDEFDREETVWVTVPTDSITVFT
jgi:spermidine/putrescine ABC transporter ATP-binding subunit